MTNLIARIVDRLRASWPGGGGTSLSDNHSYPRFCLQASRDDRTFSTFRRNPIYNEILEHVTREQGEDYLAVIASEAGILGAMEEFKANDRHGDPRTYEYRSLGSISPTTLRYVKVLVDLKRLFGTLDGRDICEIGVGYGGQCRIIDAFWRPAGYCLVDIPPALALARRYLGNFALRSPVDFRTMEALEARDHDLAISNYAFSEMPRAIQEIYLDRVIRRARRGYLTYNAITPPEFRSYAAADLIATLPGARRLDETPLTHPGNCIIVWGGRE